MRDQSPQGLQAGPDIVRVEVELSALGNLANNGGRLVPVNGSGTLIEASMNIQAGRSVALGSANAYMPNRGAFILVVTPTFDP